MCLLRVSKTEMSKSLKTNNTTTHITYYKSIWLYSLALKQMFEKQSILVTETMHTAHGFVKTIEQVQLRTVHYSVNLRHLLKVKKLNSAV